MESREINIAIFQDTEKLLKESASLQEAVQNTKDRQKLIPAETEITNPKEERENNARIIVSGKRTLEAASAYKDRKVCILNFASATNPGGGVGKGASAQEESLCRCSILYFCLDTPEMMRDFYTPHRKARNPLYNDDIIYSPDVYVVKTDTSKPERMNPEKWYKVNVITCAAPNLRKHPSNQMNPGSGDHAAKITDSELAALLERRIRRIFELAAGEGNEILVLGAFGCGAFKNPPGIVARVFHKITEEYKRRFKIIEYAVACGKKPSANYEAFRKEFCGVPDGLTN